VNVFFSKWLETLEWSGKDEFAKSIRLQWQVNNNVAGYIRAYENLSFLVVNNAGHYVPNSTPENALDMISRFVSDTPFALDPLNSFSVFILSVSVFISILL
jgi:carboxypeptidase C (cathepsin A)